MNTEVANAPVLSGRAPKTEMAILGIIAGVLLLQQILRTWVAMGLLASTGIEGEFGALVHWRVYDSFAGWIGILVLAMASNSEHKQLNRAVLTMMALGLVGMVAATALGDVSGRAIVEIVVASLLAIATAVIAARQLIDLSKSAGKVGLDLEQLWRGLALQWALLWVTAEVALRLKFWRDGIEAEPRARTILFLVPTVGLLPNVMTAMGIRWWNTLRGSPEKRPRVRAWLISMGTLNIGAALAVASVWLDALAIPGAILMTAGIAMYFVGFPRGAWRTGGGWPILLAFALLFAGLAMMAFDSSAQRDLYTAAWHHLLAGIIILWLIGMGKIAIQSVVTERLRPHAASLATATLFLLGLLAACGILLAAIQDRSMIQGLFVGAVLQLLAMIVGGAAMVRAARGVHTGTS